MMKIYIFENVLVDYTTGVIVISAKSKERAIEVYKSSILCNINDRPDITEYDLNKLTEEKILTYVHGGS